MTFWPTVTEDRLTTPQTKTCRDRKHFCVAWKKAGFCQGLFIGYMKKNCPAACGWC